MPAHYIMKILERLELSNASYKLRGVCYRVHDSLQGEQPLLSNHQHTSLSSRTLTTCHGVLV